MREDENQEHFFQKSKALFKSQERLSEAWERSFVMQGRSVILHDTAKRLCQDSRTLCYLAQESRRMTARARQDASERKKRERKEQERKQMGFTARQDAEKADELNGK